MSKITLVRGARQLLTLRGPAGPRRGADLRNLGLIQDGAVLIVEGRIAEVGPSRRVENLALARQAEEIDASGRVVMPGFVDSLTHLAAGPVRIVDQQPRGAGGELTLARAIHELSPRTLETQALHAVAGAIRHGTTTLESKSGFGLTEANEIKILRVHAALQKQGVPLISTFVCGHVPPGYPDGPAQYLEWAASHLLPSIRRRKLAEFAEISCREEGFSAEQISEFLAAARQLKFGIKVHLGERPHRGAVAVAIEAGVSSIGGPIAAEIVGMLVQSNAVVVVSPGPSFYSRTPSAPPARMLIDAGAPVALATSYHPETCPSQSMMMMIALTCSQMNMTAAEAVTAATLNGAYALRRAQSVGSLETGKNADLLVLSVPDYREIPYHFGVNLVDLVMQRGAILVKRSEVKWPNP